MYVPVYIFIAPSLHALPRIPCTYVSRQDRGIVPMVSTLLLLVVRMVTVYSINNATRELKCINSFAHKAQVSQ